MTSIPSPAPLPPEPIDLYYLAADDEDSVLALMAAYGAEEAFRETEDRLYPFVELTRVGMKRAAAMYLSLGHGRGAWSRDAQYDSAADHLASQRREEELVDLLRSRPPSASNPWRAEGLQKLWAACAEKDLYLAIDELALLAPPGALAWEAAKRNPRSDRLFERLSRCYASAKDIPRAAISYAAASLGPVGWSAVKTLCSLPDFEPGPFDNPWAGAAYKANERALRFLIGSGAPAIGWDRDRSELWDSCPWSALARSKSLFSAGLVSSASALVDAGIPPSATGLCGALETGKSALADFMIQQGAPPSERAAELSFTTMEREPDRYSPNRQSPPLYIPMDRLVEWMRSGSMDILAPPCHASRRLGRNEHKLLGWAPLIAQAASEAPKEHRERLCRSLALCLSGSKIFGQGASPERSALFKDDNGCYFRGWMTNAALTLGAPSALFARSTSSEISSALEAWWEGHVLSLSVKAKSARESAPSKPLRM